MTYAVEFKKSARKEINKLSPEVAKPILKAIYKLANNPHPPQSRKMVAGETWRLRIGNYRVIYAIHDKHLVVEVIRVGHRQSIYR